jgi:hypothetical protein
MVNQEPRDLVCNDDTFKVPPYRYETLCLVCTCPETGKTSCNLMIGPVDLIDVPEQGCTVEFRSNGKLVEQPIRLVRPDKTPEPKPEPEPEPEVETNMLSDVELQETVDEAVEKMEDNQSMDSFYSTPDREDEDAE